MKLKQLRVREKIMAAVLAIAILASVSGIISSFSMGDVQKRYHQGLEHYGFAQGSIGIVMTTAAQYDREVHDSIGFIDAGYRDTARGEISAYVETIDKYMAEIKAQLVSDEAKSYYNNAETAWNNYRNIADRLANCAGP